MGKGKTKIDIAFFQAKIAIWKALQKGVFASWAQRAAANADKRRAILHFSLAAGQRSLQQSISSWQVSFPKQFCQHSLTVAAQPAKLSVVHPDDICFGPAEPSLSVVTYFRCSCRETDPFYLQA